MQNLTVVPDKFTCKYIKINKSLLFLVSMYLAQSTNWGHFPDRIGIEKCWFLRRGKTEVHGQKPLGKRMRTNKKLNPHMTLSLGIEPGPHWWEASALTTALFLIPFSSFSSQFSLFIYSVPQRGDVFSLVIVLFLFHQRGEDVQPCCRLNNSYTRKETKEVWGKWRVCTSSQRPRYTEHTSYWGRSVYNNKEAIS